MSGWQDVDVWKRDLRRLAQLPLFPYAERRLGRALPHRRFGSYEQHIKKLYGDRSPRLVNNSLLQSLSDRSRTIRSWLYFLSEDFDEARDNVRKFIFPEYEGGKGWNEDLQEIKYDLKQLQAVLLGTKTTLVSRWCGKGRKSWGIPGNATSKNWLAEEFEEDLALVTRPPHYSKFNDVEPYVLFRIVGWAVVRRMDYGALFRDLSSFLLVKCSRWLNIKADHILTKGSRGGKRTFKQSNHAQREKLVVGWIWEKIDFARESVRNTFPSESDYK